MASTRATARRRRSAPSSAEAPRAAAAKASGPAEEAARAAVDVLAADPAIESPQGDLAGRLPARRGQAPAPRSPLLPDRRQQADFFVCDIFDAAPKGDMASMEHPVFSLSTKPDLDVRRYENGPNFVEITPSVKGLATVHDRDVLIFCISQVIAALNEGRRVDRRVRFKAYDLLKATNRGADGRGYQQLRAALERLQGTVITTNVTTGDEEIFDGFGLIDRFRIVRETRDGRMQDIEITLSDWVFNALEAREVLTLHRDYFRLRKPLERRLYELARKHCGAQSEWRIGLEKLRMKCGSTSSPKEFRRMVRRVAEEDAAHAHMPDYAMELASRDVVIFRSRGTVPVPLTDELYEGPLPPDAHAEARQAAPGWDVHALEQEWRRWCGKEEIEPKRPGRHFVKFCASWAERRGAG
ncbi:MAG: replication initiator protein A [Pseudomonadota bacterium]